MKDYLTFNENENDRVYSNSGLNFRDKAEVGISNAFTQAKDRVRDLVGRKSIDIKVDKDAIKRAKEANKETRRKKGIEAGKQITEMRIKSNERQSDRDTKSAIEKEKKDIARHNKKEVYKSGLKRLVVSEKENDKNLASNKAKMKHHFNSKMTNNALGAGAVGAVAGGAAGLGAGHLLVTKSRKQLATLVAKPTKSEHDKAEIARLRKKINLAKGVGAGLGAVAGGVGGGMYGKKVGFRKAKATMGTVKQTEAVRRPNLK